MGGPNIDNPPLVRGSSTQMISVADIISKLDFATSENVRLKEAIEENNSFFEAKLKEFTGKYGTTSPWGGVAPCPT